MSSLVDSVKSAWYVEGHIAIQIESGVESSFPVSRNPRLQAALIAIDQVYSLSKLAEQRTSENYSGGTPS
jgi:hypothetical protein